MTTLEKLEELVYVGFKETDKKWQETDKWMREMRKEMNDDLKRTRKEVAKVSDALGRFAENMVAPAIVRLMNARGIPISETSQRVQSPLRHIEYDVVAVNEHVVVVVSVKTRLNAEHVTQFVHERLSIFKEVFPRYRDMQVIGAVAGMSIEQSADVYAMNQGLFVLTQSGKNITLSNDDHFQPKVW